MKSSVWKAFNLFRIVYIALLNTNVVDIAVVIPANGEKYYIYLPRFFLEFNKINQFIVVHLYIFVKTKMQKCTFPKLRIKFQKVGNANLHLRPKSAY